MRRLETVSDIIEAAGGASKFADDLSLRRSRVSMWKVRGKFPANTRDALQPVLKQKYGIEAPASAWGQIELERT